MPKVTNILGNNKVPACESRDFVLKKKTVPKKLHFDTAPLFNIPIPYKCFLILVIITLLWETKKREDNFCYLLS